MFKLLCKISLDHVSLISYPWLCADVRSSIHNNTIISVCKYIVMIKHLKLWAVLSRNHLFLNKKTSCPLSDAADMLKTKCKSGLCCDVIKSNLILNGEIIISSYCPLVFTIKTEGHIV